MADVEDDRSLLGRWITAADKTAFATLVQRHIDFVFRAAVRQLDPVDRHMADDVTQAVFLVLHRKPRAAMAAKTLPGWLHETTYYAVANARRIAARRRQHEADAAALRSEVVHVSQDPSDEVDPPLTAKLDDAIARLGATDHALLIGRYLQGADIEVVAAQLRLTPDAARKRVERAIVKLRRYLTSSGIAGVAVPDILDALAHASLASHPPVAATLLSAAATGDGISGGAATIAKEVTTMMLKTRFAFLAAATGLAAVLTIAGIEVTSRVLAGPPSPATAESPAGEEAVKLWREVVEARQNQNNAVDTFQMDYTVWRDAIDVEKVETLNETQYVVVRAGDQYVLDEIVKRAPHFRPGQEPLRTLTKFDGTTRRVWDRGNLLVGRQENDFIVLPNLNPSGRMEIYSPQESEVGIQKGHFVLESVKRIATPGGDVVRAVVAQRGERFSTRYTVDYDSAKGYLPSSWELRYSTGGMLRASNIETLAVDLPGTNRRVHVLIAATITTLDANERAIGRTRVHVLPASIKINQEVADSTFVIMPAVKASYEDL